MTYGPLASSYHAVEPFDRRHGWWILAATVVAAVLRLYNLGEWSVWVDEAHTWRDATMRLDAFLAEDRSRYPLPFLLLRFLLGISAIGYDEWSIRMPFALVGIVTVPVLAVCGRRLVGRRASVLAAWLLACNPWHLFWSQNARGYGMAILASIIAVALLHRWLQNGRLRELVGTVVALVLGVLSHPTAGMLVVGLGGYLLTRQLLRRGRIERWWPLLVMLGFVFVGLPWLIKHFAPFQDFLAAKGDPSLLHLVETTAYYFRPSLLLLALVAIPVLAMGDGRQRTLFLACIGIVPVLVIAAVGIQLCLTTARYAICTLPIVILLAAGLMVEVERRVVAVETWSRARKLMLAAALPALVMIDFVQLDVSYFREQHGHRARWREAAEFVQQAARERGLDGVRVLTTNQPTLLYYLRRKHWFVSDRDQNPDAEVFAVLQWRVEQGIDDDRDNPTQLHDPGGEAHVLWHRRAADRRNALFALLVQVPDLRAHNPGGGIERVLHRDFEIAMHLPCWVGPKDQSIYVYLPKP